MSHRKRVLLTISIMCLAFFLGCGKKGEEAAPAPAPAPAPGTPTPPSPPPAPALGSLETASPGTKFYEIQDTDKYFETIQKAITNRGTVTVTSSTRTYYDVKQTQQGSTLTPSGSPSADSVQVASFSVMGIPIGSGWNGQAPQWFAVEFSLNAGGPLPFMPSGYDFAPEVNVQGLALYSTDQVAIFSGSSSFASEQWILKVLVGPQNPPMQVFSVAQLPNGRLSVRQMNLTTSFTAN